MTQQAKKTTTTFEGVGKVRNPRIVSEDEDGRGVELSCSGSSSAGEFGGLMANLVFDLLPPPGFWFWVEAEKGECDLLVRSDIGCKNGGENPPPGFRSRSSDELRRGLEETGFGKFWYGFR